LNPKIYFDNASTTPLLPEVIDVMTTIYKENFGNPSSIHSYGRKSRSIIEDARKKIAKGLNASIGEIFFTSSATEANNTILKRAVRDLQVKRFISSPLEHHCVLYSLESIANENKDIEVIYVDVDTEGRIDMIQLENLISNSRVKTMVSLMYGNNEIGTINDIPTISEFCHKHGVYLHCDAVQMVGKYAIDLQAIKLSFMSGTAHKFHGPKGAAFFYMNLENIITPYIHGGAQERNLRAGTENVAGIVAMASAFSIAIENLEVRKSYISELKQHFESRILKELKDVKINGEESNRMYHISSVSFPDTETADMLMFNLDIAGIAASAGSACSAGIEEDSHVLIAINHETKRKTIRFSFSIFNTMSEVDLVVDKLRTLTPIT
jgi:cysteine desulfurase